jgi:DNA repair protein RadC
LVSHNHPSGGSDPSNEDNELTKVLKNASEILGLKLLDHIILGDSGVFYSYANEGLV